MNGIQYVVVVFSIVLIVIAFGVDEWRKKNNK